MHFHLEVDYYSDEANKNKYTNFQLITSIKSNLKMAEDQSALATTVCHTFTWT